MKNFRLKKNILFVIDQKRIATVNKDTGTNLIIEYPEAAVWSVMIENHTAVKTRQMLMAVLHKSESETGKFMDHCFLKWKEADIME
ncbi:MAG: hypothetical protein WAL94_05800 [Bacteroidales bacterium]